MRECGFYESLFCRLHRNVAATRTSQGRHYREIPLFPQFKFDHLVSSLLFRLNTSYDSLLLALLRPIVLFLLHFLCSMLPFCIHQLPQKSRDIGTCCSLFAELDQPFSSTPLYMQPLKQNQCRG